MRLFYLFLDRYSRFILMKNLSGIDVFLSCSGASDLHMVTAGGVSETATEEEEEEERGQGAELRQHCPV